MSACEAITRSRQARHDQRMAEAATAVPHGEYCYAPVGADSKPDGMPILKVKPCPYFKRRGDWPEQRNGYCRLLKAGDHTPGRDRDGQPRSTMLLWDSVKACGINLTPDGEIDHVG